MKRIPLSKDFLIGSGLLFAGFIACQLSYAVIGQRIEKDGTLREPFFPIPISALMLLGSSASMAGAGVARLKQGRGSHG